MGKRESLIAIRPHCAASNREDMKDCIHFKLSNNSKYKCHYFENYRCTNIKGLIGDLKRYQELFNQNGIVWLNGNFVDFNEL